MTRTVEGARIFLGPRGEPEDILRRFVGATEAQSEAALQRCKDLLIAVTHWVAPLDGPVSIDDWKAHVPDWFVAACAPELSAAEIEDELRSWRELDSEGKARYDAERAWTFGDWIFWFDPNSDLRRSWRWWDGGTVDESKFWIEVEVRDDPGAIGTLTWMMRAAGALHVAEDPPVGR